MIIQTAPAGAPRLAVMMHEHTALSGQFARAFGNDHFEPVWPHDLMFFIVSHHDAGWAEFDRDPVTDERTGLPYNLVETPVEYITITSRAVARFQRAAPPLLRADIEHAQLGPLACWLETISLSGAIAGLPPARPTELPVRYFRLAEQRQRPPRRPAWATTAAGEPHPLMTLFAQSDRIGTAGQRRITAALERLGWQPKDWQGKRWWTPA